VLIVARHRAVDDHRQLARRPTAPLPLELLGDWAAPDDPVAAVLEAQSTRAALALLTELPVEHAEVVALRVLGGLGVDEVDTIMVMLRPSGRVWLAGAVGNALVIVVWILSRTVGLPWGPEAGQAEPVGFVDALSTAYEALLVAGAAALAWSATRRELRSGGAQAAIWAVGGLVVPLTLLAVLNAVGALSLLGHP
jgi:hypothetical protein